MEHLQAFARVELGELGDGFGVAVHVALGDAHAAD